MVRAPVKDEPIIDKGKATRNIHDWHCDARYIWVTVGHALRAVLFRIVVLLQAGMRRVQGDTQGNDQGGDDV